MSRFHNPLNSHALDEGLNQLTTILGTNPVDGAVIISDLQAWLRDPSRENLVVRQILDLYLQARLTSSTHAALIDDALSQV